VRAGILYFAVREIIRQLLLLFLRVAAKPSNIFVFIIATKHFIIAQYYLAENVRDIQPMFDFVIIIIKYDFRTRRTRINRRPYRRRDIGPLHRDERSAAGVRDSILQTPMAPFCHYFLTIRPSDRVDKSMITAVYDADAFGRKEQDFIMDVLTLLSTFTST